MCRQAGTCNKTLQTVMICRNLHTAGTNSGYQVSRGLNAPETLISDIFVSTAGTELHYTSSVFRQRIAKHAGVLRQFQGANHPGPDDYLDKLEGE